MLILTQKLCSISGHWYLGFYMVSLLWSVYKGIKMVCHWQILIFRIVVATVCLSRAGFSVTFGNPWDRQKTMCYDADNQTILGIASHIPCSCQYPIWRLSLETMPHFAIICPAVGFPSVLPVQQTGLSQPVWLSDSAVYNNNETAVNPIWHVFRQSQATSFSRMGKAFKQVVLVWWGWNRASAPLLKPECSVRGMHETHWVMKGAKIPFQVEKSTHANNSGFFPPLFIFYFLPAELTLLSALLGWNRARFLWKDKQEDL